MDSILPPTSAVAPVITTAIKSRREPRPLIGDFIRRPAWLWLTHVLPTTLLFAWAAHSFAIIRTDLSAGAIAESATLALALGASAAASGFMAFSGERGRLLSLGQCGALLVMSLAVMGAGMLFTLHTVPWQVPMWLLDRDELLFEAFCLAMPGAFYAILILSSQPLRRHGGVEFGYLVLATVIGALAFYGLLMFLIWTRFSPPAWINQTILLLALFGGGTAITGLITRSTLIAYTGIRRLRPVWQRCFMFVIAVAGPIGGLYLNKSIPFPVDLQAPIIYLLALINGGLLMLPAVRSIFWHRVIWLAQCLLFPFSAYFFILFLPLMPLSLFAMIAAGAGFLMLVPLVLGISHTYRLVDGYREEVRDGRRWPVAVAGVCAVLALPAVGVWDMTQDRLSLDEALVYLYSPDYRKDVTFPGNLTRLSSALEHLRDAKRGIYLPFLTPLYNEIVFHGLVLPDAKINEMQAAFFGYAPTLNANPMLRSLSLDDRAWDDGDDGFMRPDHSVALDDATVTEQPSGTTTTAQILLTMHNIGSSGSAEFITHLHIPDGVYVSGFTLKIGDNFVPARIVEKKTAVWVYEQITKVGSGGPDPGILTYDSRTDLTLRIAPFTVGQIREARLELTYTNPSPVDITIGEKTVHLGAASAATGALTATTCATDSGSLALVQAPDAATWQIQRTPYLDILVDCSNGAHYSASSLGSAIDQARRAFPDAKLARVTAVNFEARDLVSDLLAVDQLNAANLAANLLPSRGGLLQDRFLKRGLLLADDLMQSGADKAMLRPQFVLISSLGQAGRHENHLDDFLRLAPDARVIYAETTSGISSHEDMLSRQPVARDDNPAVVLWRWGNRYAVHAAEPRMALSFSGGALSGSPEVYDPAQRQFTAVTNATAVPSDSRFADGVRTWAAQEEAEFDPKLLSNGAAALIGLSKKTGILVPDSSYIVVEATSQWAKMAELEKKKLHNNQVFEFEEPAAVPEPSTWMMFVLGIAMMAIARWRRSKSRS